MLIGPNFNKRSELMKCVGIVVMLMVCLTFYAKEQNIRSSLKPFFYKGMSFNYFQNIKSDDKSSRKIDHEYGETLIIHNIISEMNSLVGGKINRNNIRPLMQAIIRMNGDQYYMFYEFMKQKNRTEYAQIWMDEYIVNRLRDSNSFNTHYVNKILADYLRGLLKIDAKNIKSEQQQMAYQMTLSAILAYEAENNSVLILLKQEELSMLSNFCKSLGDPMEYCLSVYIDEYKRNHKDIVELFMRYYPSMPYPSSFDDVQDVSLGVRLTIYNILLSQDTHTKDTEVWYKNLYEGGTFFYKFVFYRYK